MSTNLWTKVNTLSFKTKAVLVAIAIGTTPIVLIGATNYLQVSNANKQQAVKNERERAELIADKLNRFIFERNGDVTILSTLPIFTDPKVTAITSAESRSQLLDRFIAIYGVYDNIAIFDLKGDPVVQSKGSKLSNHFDRKYIQEVFKTGKTVTSEASISKSTGKLVIHFAAPVKNLTTGQITGVIRTRTPVDRLETVLNDFATKDRGYHILDRRNNKILISSNREYKNQPETPAIAQARTTGGLISSQQPGANNRTELLSAAPLKKLEKMTELPWTAVSAIDEAAAYVELEGLLLIILLEAGLTAALTVGLFTLFADRITKYIRRTIATITNSANEIVDTVQSQEITVNQQANSAISTTNSINELESISTETAEQASASANGAKQALSLAEDGTQAVQRTIHEMSDLRDRVDEIAQQIVNLGEQTGQITTVSDLVSDLAKQTNMLALKAAVEAARAGEQGKGFGVVAGEIRKLADESKKSAQKINNLATDIQAAINRTVMVTDRGTKTATEGIQLAESTAVTFIGVTDAVNNVFLNSQQISSSTKRQATAIQQVLGAMNAISQGSQESAVGMHRVKMSTSELNQIADELQAAVS
jgi:Methyl-accepting chemotaxis protein (MCP) signalling domain